MTTTIYSGLSLGAVYVLIVVLFTLPLVRSGVFNFAQAHYLALGAFLCADMMTRLDLPIAVVLPVLLVVGGLLGLVQELVTVRPVSTGEEGRLLTTVGFAVAIEGFMIYLWGNDPRSVSFFGGERPIELLGGRLKPVDLFLIVLAVVVAVGAEVALRRTRWGVVGRAAMTDATLSAIRGVDVPRLRVTAFVVAGSLSCALAVVAAPKVGVTTSMPLRVIIFSFAAATLGGLGTFRGALLGGFGLGLVEAFASRYLGTEYVVVLLFAILAAVLVVHPTGVFGRKTARVV